MASSSSPRPPACAAVRKAPACEARRRRSLTSPSNSSTRCVDSARRRAVTACSWRACREGG
eukprot:6958851-Alexandrium_andersonii.AAC.1